MIEVFGKPGCVQCTATTRALDAAGLTYDYRDVTTDADALQQVLALGYRAVPVVVAGPLHWSGFQPGKIAGLEAFVSTNCSVDYR